MNYQVNVNIYSTVSVMYVELRQPFDSVFHFERSILNVVLFLQQLKGGCSKRCLVYINTSDIVILFLLLRS